MSFHWPQVWWALLIPIALMIWELTRRKRASAAAHPKILRAEASPTALTLSNATTRASTSPRVQWRLWLGLVLLVGALSRPQWGRIEEQVFDQAREVLIAVDLSRSMLAPDVPPSRLERAKLLITSLLERLEGERVGLIVFAGTAFLQSPLSADYEILREFLPALGPDFLPQGGTDFQAMLQTALDAFGEGPGADRFLIVLSDGEAQSEEWQKHVTALRDRGVRVLSLGLGTADGAMLPDGQGGLVKDERGAVVLSRLNPSTLEELARRTNGVYRDASSWVELAQLLRETVEAGREGQFTETSKVRQVERFQWLLAPALLLLIWSFWQEFPVHPRHRSMKLAPTPPSSPSPSASRPTPTTAAGQVAAIALSLAATFATSSRASAQADGNPFAGPLSQVVGRLVGQPNLAAKDYAELAQATITYGERMSGAQQQAEPGAIDDALQAVDAGRALDPKAADWDQLKQKLEALRPPEQQQPQQQQQTESEKDQSDSSEQDQQGQGEPPQDQSGQSKDQQNQERDRQNTDSEANENEQSQQSPPQEQSSDRSAFGEMEQPPPEGGEESDEPPPDTQKVGGQSERRMEEEQNPTLTVPLQKLEQLKQQDSPAKLYQLMQDPNARPTPKGRDW